MREPGYREGDRRRGGSGADGSAWLLGRGAYQTEEREAIFSDDQYSRRLAMSWPSKTRIATSRIRLRTFWGRSSNSASHSTMAVLPSRNRLSSLQVIRSCDSTTLDCQYCRI